MSSPAPSLRRRPEAERRQIYAALVDVCLERGFPGASLELVIERAAVDRPTFNRHFSDLGDCFGQYIAEALIAFVDEIEVAAADEEAWRTQVRNAVQAMVRFCRADEARAHMLLVETLAAGPLGQLIRDRALEKVTEVIDRGRLLMDDPTLLTRLTAEAMAGALFSQMHRTMEQGILGEADDLVPQLMYCVVLPYLGVEAAVEELSPPPFAEP